MVPAQSRDLEDGQQKDKLMSETHPRRDVEANNYGNVDEVDNHDS
jgi:hypothetical protein